MSDTLSRRHSPSKVARIAGAKTYGPVAVKTRK